MNESTGIAPTTEKQGLNPATRMVFIGPLLGMLVAAVSQTIVAPAMPIIVAEVAGIEHFSWLAAAAMLVSLDLSTLADLPPAIADAVRQGMADALHGVFVAAMPLVLVAIVASLLIKPIPLREPLQEHAADAEPSPYDTSAAEPATAEMIAADPTLPDQPLAPSTAAAADSDPAASLTARVAPGRSRAADHRIPARAPRR